MYACAVCRATLGARRSEIKATAIAVARCPNYISHVEIFFTQFTKNGEIAVSEVS